MRVREKESKDEREGQRELWEKEHRKKNYSGRVMGFWRIWEMSLNDVESCLVVNMNHVHRGSVTLGKLLSFSELLFRPWQMGTVIVPTS